MRLQFPAHKEIGEHWEPAFSPASTLPSTSEYFLLMSTGGDGRKPPLLAGMTAQPVSSRARLILITFLGAAVVCALIIAALLLLNEPFRKQSAHATAHGEAIPRKQGSGTVIATQVFTGADDFVVDVFHNGQRVPLSARSITSERFGATGESTDITVREGDWLVFNVVNNRLRWGGVYYFGAAGVRQDGAVGFNSEESPLWSVCEDPGLVPHFITDPEFLATNRARRIETPWDGCDKMIRAHVPDWSGYAIWGDPTNRNVWIKFHARPQP